MLKTQNRPNDTRPWARQWLDEVDQARRAIEDESRALRVRRMRLGSISDPLGHDGPGGKGTVSDPMRPVDAVVDSEAALRGGAASPLRWAFEKRDEFDRAMASLRAGCTGDILNGTYAAELRYRLGCSEQEAASHLGYSKSTLHQRIAALVDYLDMIGPKSVLGDTQTQP